MRSEHRGSQALWLRAEDQGAVQKAAEILLAGGIVAFPTETVYGLGAVVDQPRAIRRVFEAKDRPEGVPLIAHVTGWMQARELVEAGMYSREQRMIERWWPGPLTLVLPKAEWVPAEASGGKPTIGIRAPDHPVAQQMLQLVGRPVVAPSANPHGQLPPVRAEHVLAELGQRIDAVLDGGKCPGGLESTVLDVSRGEEVRVLRDGAVSIEELRRFVHIEQRREQRPWERDGWSGGWLSVRERDWLRNALGHSIEKTTAVVWCGERDVAGRGDTDVVLADDPREYAAELYDVLHGLRVQGIEQVWVEAPPRKESWRGVWARFARLVGTVAPLESKAK